MRLAHSIQNKLWPHGTRAATTSLSQQMTQSFFLRSLPSGLNVVLLLFASSAELKPMVLTPFVSLVLTVPLELVAGMDETFDVVTWVVNGVNADSGEKFPFRGSLFMRLAVVCGLAGRPIAEFIAWLFKLELRVNAAGSLMERVDCTFPQMDGDGGAGAGSNPEPDELPSDPTSRSGEGSSLKKKLFAENGLVMGLNPPSLMLELLLLG